MSRITTATVFLLATVPQAFGGDSKWWGTRIGGFSFGVGEISNHILIYWGDSYWRTPLPSGHKWLILYQVFLAAIILTTVTLIVMRRRKV